MVLEELDERHLVGIGGVAAQPGVEVEIGGREEAAEGQILQLKGQQREGQGMGKRSVNPKDLVTRNSNKKYKIIIK